ncbi:mCG146097, partial [Mus musculus]
GCPHLSPSLGLDSKYVLFSVSPASSGGSALGSAAPRHSASCVINPEVGLTLTQSPDGRVTLSLKLSLFIRHFYLYQCCFHLEI